MGRKRTNKPPRDYHHGDLRNALLEASAELIEAEGISGFSLRDVARQAGVSHAAPYRHFETRNTLLAELARLGFERLTEAMQKTASVEDPLERLAEAGLAYVDLAVSYPEATRLMFGGLIPEEDITAELQAAGTAAFQALMDLIGRGQEAGAIVSGDTRDLAIALWSLVHGAATLATGQHTREAGEVHALARAQAERSIRFMLQGIVPHKQ